MPKLEEIITEEAKKELEKLSEKLKKAEEKKRRRNDLVSESHKV